MNGNYKPEQGISDMGRRSMTTTNGSKSRNIEEEIDKARKKMKKLEQDLLEINNENHVIIFVILGFKTAD